MQPFTHPSDDTHKIWSRLATGLRDIQVQKCGRWTDGRPLVYYKLTLWAFSSGELKILQKSLQKTNSAKNGGIHGDQYVDLTKRGDSLVAYLFLCLNFVVFTFFLYSSSWCRKKGFIFDMWHPCRPFLLVVLKEICAIFIPTRSDTEIHMENITLSLLGVINGLICGMTKSENSINLLKQMNGNPDLQPRWLPWEHPHQFLHKYCPGLW